MIDLQNIDNKESIVKDFFTWIFDDNRIITKDISLQSEVDLSLAPFYMDPNIYFPKQISNFFETKAMKRLGRISQLSLLINSSPNTFHNRLEHSKGTYNRKLEEMLYNFQNPDWKKYIEKNNLKLYLLGDLIKMAGHDIGHFPLSHAFEEQIYNNHEAHEILGQRIMLEDEEIQNVLTSISTELPAIMKELYEKEILNFSSHDESNYDVDRIDYLSRDSLYLGSPQNIPTQKYERIRVATDTKNKPLMNNDFSIVESNTGNSFIDVYDYSSLNQIESLLELRYSEYQNTYMSKRIKVDESAIGIFLKAFLSTNSECGKDLRDFISHLQNIDIKEANLSEFLKWDDITLYEQIIEIAEKHEDSNVRALATMNIPNMNSFLNMIYNHLNLQNNKNLSTSDLNFLKKIKNIIKSNTELSRNLRDSDFVLKNTLINQSNSSLPSKDDLFCNFSYNLHAYTESSPIYIRDKNGKIYELSNHPERKCNWNEKTTLLQTQYAYIPFLRLNGITEREINNFRNVFNDDNSKYNQSSAKYNKNRPTVNMQPLQVGHNIEDYFLEL